MEVSHDLENIKTDRVKTVIFDLHEIKQLKFFWGHPVKPGNKTSRFPSRATNFESYVYSGVGTPRMIVMASRINFMHQSIPIANILLGNPRGFTQTFSLGPGICTI